MTISTIRLEEMLQRGQADDPLFAEGLVRQYSPAVFGLARAMLGEEAEAQDAMQETFIAALNSIHRYRLGSDLKAWLGGIAVHKCYAILRKRKRSQALNGALHVVQRLFGHAPSTLESVVQNEMHAGLWQAVGALDEKHRLPLVLYYVYELPVAEIAGVLNVPKGTVQSRLHYALQELRGQLQRQDLHPVLSSSREEAEA